MNKLQEVCTTLVLCMTCSHLQSPLCHLHPNSMLLAEHMLEGPVTLVQENCMGSHVASPGHRNISEVDLLAVKLNFCFCSFISKQVKNTQSFLLYLPTASVFSPLRCDPVWRKKERMQKEDTWDSLVVLHPSISYAPSHKWVQQVYLYATHHRSQEMRNAVRFNLTADGLCGAAFSVLGSPDAQRPWQTEVLSSPCLFAWLFY